MSDVVAAEIDVVRAEVLAFDYEDLPAERERCRILSHNWSDPPPEPPGVAVPGLIWVDWYVLHAARVMSGGRPWGRVRRWVWDWWHGQRAAQRQRGAREGTRVRT